MTLGKGNFRCQSPQQRGSETKNYARACVRVHARVIVCARARGLGMHGDRCRQLERQRSALIGRAVVKRVLIRKQARGQSERRDVTWLFKR